MAKKGIPYERVVSEIIKAFDPGATVRQGIWLEGPDGRRELDVHVSGTVARVEHHTLVECKDFNPTKTGPVGIGYVDALDSKRRDLDINTSLICSNSGFTADAISKAKRVDIGLIAVMKKGDSRIRYSVAETLYIRRVKVEKLSIGLRGPGTTAHDGLHFEEILYNGVPVGNWVILRAKYFVASNPIVNGSFTITHQMKVPTQLQLPAGPVLIDAIDFYITISGGWFEQPTTIDAAGAVYDWLRRRIRPIPGQNMIQFNYVDCHGGKPIKAPPESALSIKSDRRRGEFSYMLVYVEGLEERNPVPDIDSLIEPSDLDLTLSDLPVDTYTSSA